ncbi:uncharacterized protein VP01_4670g1 [Puccinia sorghi]|uniref:Uncharacterized protein n=1 Tax=Puccinia sorghi TaxID=27349 RepID=A0A0L6UNZ0_9BASI|nr:uncharacterized protein VP01_4670g1 [Puccinia sorghi]
MASLEKIHELQKAQQDELAKSGGYFNNLSAHDKEQESSLLLLWSGKSVLFQMAVKLQSKLQPLRNSKDRGDRLGTRLKEKIFAALNRRKNSAVNVINQFCKRRTDHLIKFSPDLVGLPENQSFNYKFFLTMTLDDPIWNDSFLCTARAWASDARVRQGIHAVLSFDRVEEEIDRLKIELHRVLS